MNKLQKFSTRYIPVEDRIRLLGESESGETFELWLTQRWLDRLVPALCQILESQDRSRAQPKKGGAERWGQADAMQTLAQERARAGSKRLAPVSLAAGSQSWVVQRGSLNRLGSGVHLTFKGGEPDQIAVLTLQFMALRQWLNILCDQCQQAQWPLPVWPEWILDAQQVRVPPANALH